MIYIINLLIKQILFLIGIISVLAASSLADILTIFLSFYTPYKDVDIDSIMEIVLNDLNYRIYKRLKNHF